MDSMGHQPSWNDVLQIKLTWAKIDQFTQVPKSHNTTAAILVAIFNNLKHKLIKATQSG